MIQWGWSCSQVLGRRTVFAQIGHGGFLWVNSKIPRALWFNCSQEWHWYVFNPTTKLHEFTNREHRVMLLFLSLAAIGPLGINFRAAELAVQYVQFAVITFTVIFGTFGSNWRKRFAEWYQHIMIGFSFFFFSFASQTWGDVLENITVIAEYSWVTI